MHLVVSLLLVSALGVWNLGCAPSYYDTYKEKEPHWYGGAPSAGSSLHEVLATLYSPPVADYSLIVAKLSVLQLRGGSSVVLDSEQVDAILAADTPADYGVVATLFCRSEFNLQRYYGEKVAWYLLKEGKLTAYDHFDFVDLCTVSNEFLPARGDKVALETQVIAYRDEYFPKSMEHVGELYRRGLAYLRAERPDEAVRMLQAGDAALDVGDRGERHIDKESSTQLRTSKASDVERLRAALIERLAEAEAVAPES